MTGNGFPGFSKAMIKVPSEYEAAYSIWVVKYIPDFQMRREILRGKRNGEMNIGTQSNLLQGKWKVRIEGKRREPWPYQPGSVVAVIPNPDSDIF